MFKSRQAFILFTVFLDTVGIGLLVPIFPDIMRRYSESTADTAEHFGFFIGIYAFMQFLASPILGSLSDRFGRKPILLFSLLGAGIDYIFMAIAPSFRLLLVGRVIAGLTGASMTVANSYMADITPEAERAKSFGLVGAAWGLGFISGPSLGALASWLHPQAPFFIAALLNLFIFLFGLLVLPESLAIEHRRPIRFSEMNPFRSISKVMRTPSLGSLVLIYFMIFLAGQSLPVNWNLYTELKFNWNPLQLGLSLSAMGLIVAFSQGYLTRIVIPRLGQQRAVTFGLLFYISTYLIFSLARNQWELFGGMAIFSLTGVSIPSLQSIMTSKTSRTQQGELQGTLVAIGSLASVLAPIAFTPIFVYFTQRDAFIYFPGIIFFLAALLSTLTLVFWSWINRRSFI